MLVQSSYSVLCSWVVWTLRAVFLDVNNENICAFLALLAFSAGLFASLGLFWPRSSPELTLEETEAPSPDQ